MNNALRSEALVSNSISGMVYVPAGTFRMGSSSGSPAERPVHDVYLDGFWCDATPVTNMEFDAFVEATGYVTEAELAGSAWGIAGGRFGMIPGISWRTYATPDRVAHPVVLVTWADAQAFARHHGKALPTEAQWEKVARDGFVERRFPWGDQMPSKGLCRYGETGTSYPATASVAQHPASRLGVYDLVGNVWQWCRDWFASDYRGDSSMTNPVGPTVGTLKVRRGGAWNVVQPFRLRCSNRGAAPPYLAAPNIGFRCVRDTNSTFECAPPVSVLQPTPMHGRIAEVRTSSAGPEGEVETLLLELRPAMEADGGGVQVVDANDGIVRLRLVGTCTSCPSAILTLESIARLLRRRLPWVRDVQAIEH